MKSRSLAYACVVAGVFFCAALPARANPLNKELYGLLSSHPDILAAEKGLGSSQEEINKANAGYLPTLSVTGDSGYQIFDSPSRRSTHNEPFSRGRETASATLTQNLFNGYATTSDVRIAKLNAEVAGLSLEGTRQNTLLEGTRAYLAVLRQRRLIELSVSNTENIQIQLNLEDERVQRGAGIAVDVLQAKSRLQIARERLVTFQGALEDAISRYVQVFDHAPNMDTIGDPAAPILLIPPDLETAIETARSTNPAVINSDTTIAVRQEQKDRVRSEYYPSIDLVGSWNMDKHVDGTIGVKREYQVLLQASWDLFTGFTTRASEAQAAFNYGASKDIRNLTTRRVTEQTRVSWRALLTAHSRVQLLENAVNIAAEVFDARQKLREAGKETVINVLDAENEIFNARINYVQASYDEQLAIYQLLLAMGQLNAEILGLGSG